MKASKQEGDGMTSDPKVEKCELLEAHYCKNIFYSQQVKNKISLKQFSDSINRSAKLLLINIECILHNLRNM